ncbi:unnamed protein product [Symbiodinium natans]|uniref:Uncharacterized protein n=1 Tax=Symbiodinium natans TaxID=878477 RepID=A0A812HYR8_9DINO|nr:unnamed protein product [Symbiodinium natans]
MEWANTGAVLGTFDVNEALGLARVLGEEFCVEFTSRFDMTETGEYDTQDKYKRVGNPISWANPTGGGTVEDNSSKHWTWVYPAGAFAILAFCGISRWRSLRKENEEQVIASPRINMPDTGNFGYKPPSQEPLSAEDLAPSPSSETESGFGPGWGNNFTPPPRST